MVHPSGPVLRYAVMAGFEDPADVGIRQQVAILSGDGCCGVTARFANGIADDT